MKFNTAKLFSILLAISWFVVLFCLLYPVLRHDTTPNFWLLIALVGIPLLMLIQKLKIGSFFDFSKSDSPPHQPTTTIGQQINLPIMGQELAEAITESITKALEHQKEHLRSSSQKKYSKYNRMNYSIDLVLMNSLPTIMAYYSFLTTVVPEKPSKIPDDNLNETLGLLANIALSSPENQIDYTPVLPLIRIIQANLQSAFGSDTEALLLHLSHIQKLIELRASTASKTDELNFSKETIGILTGAIEGVVGLSYYMSGNWAGLKACVELSVSKLKALVEEEIINKSGNKQGC